jgi:hypothetical protein
MGKSLCTPPQFQAQVLPELLRRWDSHCFCRNGNFLKLIAFDFRDYDIGPARLEDSEQIVAGLIFPRFEALGDWTEAGRTLRCPQCGAQFQSQYEQFSINMDCTTTRPVNPLPMAPVGRFLIGYQYFAGADEEIARISDFKLADSVEKFIADLSVPPAP